MPEESDPPDLRGGEEGETDKPTRSYVNKKGKARSQFGDGDKVWLWHPDGQKFPMVVGKAYMIPGTNKMEYELIGTDGQSYNQGKAVGESKPFKGYMDKFEKDAIALEGGQSPDLSLTETPTSPTTVTSSTGPLIKGEHESNFSNQKIGPGFPRSVPWSSVWRSCTQWMKGESRNTSNEDSLERRETESSSCDTIDQGFIFRSLKDFPSGYPNLATFADSDESFGLYRRFGYLQARVLLEKQDELRCLEEQLDALDSKEQYSEPTKLSRREKQGEQRKELLTQIEARFSEYSQLLISAQQLMSFNRPSKSEHESVLNYVYNQCPVHEKESQFVYFKEDLITLRPGREHAWIDRAIERALKMAPKLFRKPLQWIFCPKGMKEKAYDESQVYYSKERIEGCSSIVITMTIGLMLVLPIYLLYHLVEQHSGQMTPRSNAVYMGILLTFTLAFAAIMWYFTKAKRHEILGAAAAYCAVLVVFLGNLGNATLGG